jgi:DNA/RNA-binding domain of Phe-tRNA-synthetase-like protein
VGGIGRFFPLAVKAATQPCRRDASGFGAFRKTYPHLDVAPGLVICPCEALRRISEEDYALPWDALLPP